MALVGFVTAGDLTGKRIYVNPGHGSYGPNDRPMPTIPYPNLSSTGMPDTCGFYETNTNLQKCLYLRDRLVAAGATVVMSREENGPWPYEKVNGEYPSYSWEDYQNRPDYQKYNKALSVICEEVESGNYDLFISVHSNAASEGTTTNYPIWLYRGYDAATTDFEKECKAFGAAMWPYRFEPMTEGYDHHSAYSATNMALRGDVSFMGSGSNSTRSNGKTYYGYYGVLKHGTVGGIFEGYFHTYQPARHRALNNDNCHMEGYCYYRGIVDYFGADKDTKGYILGLIKDEHERISHPLYNYAPKMHDQWLPLNGAVVTLYKGGKKIADYTVDNNYNGVFYFGDLEPGDDYTLDATCEGYKPMWDEYKQPISVSANKITYPRIYLEDVNYEAPKEVYYTYPEPEIPAYMGVAGSYNMKGVYADEAIAELSGKTIRRSIVRNDTTMYVLAIDNNNEPSLYLINPSTHAVKASLPTEFCTVSAEGKLRLSDIAVTAEGVLIGCNEEKTTYTPSNQWQVYKWTESNGTWSGSVWLTTTNNETAGNFSNAISGSTLAYAGTLEDGYLYSTAYTIGSDPHAVRYFVYTIAAGNYAGAFRNQNPDHKLAEMGHDIQFTVSPAADNKIIITAGNIAPMEWTTVTATASAPVIATMPESFKGVKGISFFKYAKHNLMVVPSEEKSGGAALYDISEGVTSPTELALNVSGTTLTGTPQAASSVVSKAGDITIYVTADAAIAKLTTADVAQPVVAHVNAYNLKLSYDEVSKDYTFSYTANSAARSTAIVFYQNGKEVGKVAVASAVAGENAATINQADLPGFTATPTTWAVELTGENIARWGEIHGQTKEELGMARIFNTIDNNPENPTFQRIYLADYVRNSASSGLYIVNPDYSRENTTPMLGGNALFGCLYRIGIDAEGYVYMPDWTDGNSGVYIANPNDLSTFPNLFQGTRDGNGVISNNGINVGSSTPAVYVYGKGADTKLIVYNEDPGSSLVTNGLCIYNIGQADGTIKRTWNEAPSKVLSIPGQLNSEGNVYATARGIWVSQNRTNGNNNTSATSLQFFDWEGNRKMSSALDPYKDVIIGSEGSAFTLSRDESMLVLNNGDKEFMVFDIEWQADNTPVLSLRHTYKHGYGASNTNAFRQLNFDYAGNLIATGDPGFYVFSMPTDNNVTVVPAKSSLTVEKPFSGQVEGVWLDKQEAALVKGESLTLTATVMPEAATNKNVTWSTSNANVATVSDGVVSAVASGKATITVKTEEGEYSATCEISVTTPVTGISLDKTEAALTKGQTLTLTASIAPADADNKTVTWRSSNTKVASVSEGGVVTALSTGTTTIYAISEDGEYSATCEISVTTPVTGIELDITEVTITEGETVTLAATILPTDADNQGINWSSSDEAVASVAEGVVTAVAAGEATITVMTEDGGYTATCVVTVEKAIVRVTGVTLNMDSLYFDMGSADEHSQYLVATVLPADATDKSVTWESSNPTVATVDEGTVTCMTVGNTTITVRTNDGGFTASCEVTVERHDGIFDIAIDGISYRDYTIYNAHHLHLTVMTADGKLVAMSDADISLSGMPAGTYLVRTPNGKVLKVLR